MEWIITKTFKNYLIIEPGPGFKKIVYKTDIDVVVMANDTKFLKQNSRFEDVEFYLWNCIITIDCKSLQSHSIPGSIIHG